MRLYLGNRNALTADPDGSTRTAKGKQCTTVDFPEGTSLGEAFTVLTASDGVWANHAKAGSTPAWVASDSAALATLVADHFGGIEIRDVEV